jgi:GNAT superfamily N-acetyltransferase
MGSLATAKKAKKNNKKDAQPPAGALFHGQQTPQTDLRILSGLGWLDQVVAVHRAVRAEMPPAQRHCLMEKSEAYFRDLLTGAKGVLFGVVLGEQVVGFMGVVRQPSFAAAKAAHAITCPDEDGQLAAVYGDVPVAVAQSLCVLKAHGGKGYSHALIKAVAAWAEAEGYAHLFAQIAQENVVSWMRFLANRFAIVAGWTSGHARFLMRHMSQAEISRQMGRALKSDLTSVKKDYAELPALLVVIGAMLRKKRIVLAHGAEPSSDRLNLVFGTR